MQVRQLLRFFKLHLFALLAKQLVQSSLNLNLFLLAHIFCAKLRTFLQSNQTHRLLLSVERLMDRRIQRVITLGKFAVTLRIRSSQLTFVIHFHCDTLTFCLESAQVVDGRFHLDFRLIKIVVRLELDKVLLQRIQHLQAKFYSVVKVFTALTGLLGLERVEHRVRFIKHERCHFRSEPVIFILDGNFEHVFIRQRQLEVLPELFQQICAELSIELVMFRQLKMVNDHILQFFRIENRPNRIRIHRARSKAKQRSI